MGATKAMRTGAAATAPGSAGVKAVRPAHLCRPTEQEGQSFSSRSGDSAVVIFEQQRDRFTWRFEVTVWNGEQRLQVWPWYQPKDGGDLRPCSARYGTGGFAIPHDRIGQLINALQAIAPR